MKKLGLALGAALVICINAVLFYPPARPPALVLAGRGGGCTLARAIESPQAMLMQVEISDRFRKEMKLVEQDAAGYQLWQTPRGRYWMPRGSAHALAYDLAEQERNIYGTGVVGVHPGDVVLDCGANVGVFIRKAMSLGARTVVAIEIAPENIECLRRNFAEEVKAGRVVIYPKGVWDKDDVMTLTVDPENSAADTVAMNLEKGQKGPQVPLTTIDKLVAELKLDRVDYVKMDIEGAEQKALAGGAATLAKYHPRLALASYHRLDDAVKIPERVHAAWSGYRKVCGPCTGSFRWLRADVLSYY